jgi:lycopene cyclase domain-containing protein
LTAFGRLAYLLHLLPWALPIIAGEWLVFPAILRRTARRWLPTALGATLYLSIADGLGIASDIWQVADRTTLGVRFLGVLPFEESLFFLLTTLMVAQTTLLCLWYFDDLPGEPWPGWRAARGSTAQASVPRSARRTSSRSATDVATPESP